MSKMAKTLALLLVMGLLPAVAGSKVKLGKRGEIRIDDKPFFPLFVWNQPLRLMKHFKNQGINTIVPGEKGDSRRELLDQAKANGMYIILEGAETNPEFAKHPALLCYKFGDEPDMAKRGPDGKAVLKVSYEDLLAMNRRVHQKDPNHPTWLNLTPRFYGHYHSSYVKRGQAPTLEVYRSLGNVADIMSFDHYPITGWNQPKRIAELYHATAEFSRLYPGKPIWVIVENADQDLRWTPKNTRGPYPNETRAMVWMCIVAGAKGIGYFPIAFGPFRWDNSTNEMKVEMKRLNDEITALTPVLCDGKLLKSKSSNDQIKIRALKYEGRTTVVSVNLSREEQKAEIKVRGLKGQGRSRGAKKMYSASGGGFSLQLGPLAESIIEF